MTVELTLEVWHFWAGLSLAGVVLYLVAGAVVTTIWQRWGPGFGYESEKEYERNDAGFNHAVWLVLWPLLVLGCLVALVMFIAVLPIYLALKVSVRLSGVKRG